MANEKTEQIMVHAQPVKIELHRSSKSEYYWTVNVYAEDVDLAVLRANEADRLLRQQYLVKPEDAIPE